MCAQERSFWLPWSILSRPSAIQWLSNAANKNLSLSIPLPYKMKNLPCCYSSALHAQNLVHSEPKAMFCWWHFRNYVEFQPYALCRTYNLDAGTLANSLQSWTEQRPCREFVYALSVRNMPCETLNYPAAESVPPCLPPPSRMSMVRPLLVLFPTKSCLCSLACLFHSSLKRKRGGDLGFQLTNYQDTLARRLSDKGKKKEKKLLKKSFFSISPLRSWGLCC